MAEHGRRQYFSGRLGSCRSSQAPLERFFLLFIFTAKRLLCAFCCATAFSKHETLRSNVVWSVIYGDVPRMHNAIAPVNKNPPPSSSTRCSVFDVFSLHIGISDKMVINPFSHGKRKPKTKLLEVLKEQHMMMRVFGGQLYMFEIRLCSLGFPTSVNWVDVPISGMIVLGTRFVIGRRYSQVQIVETNMANKILCSPPTPSFMVILIEFAKGFWC